MSQYNWRSKYFDLFVVMFVCALSFALLSMEGYAAAQEVVLHTLISGEQAPPATGP